MFSYFVSCYYLNYNKIMQFLHKPLGVCKPQTGKCWTRVFITRKTLVGIIIFYTTQLSTHKRFPITYTQRISRSHKHKRSQMNSPGSRVLYTLEFTRRHPLHPQSRYSLHFHLFSKIYEFLTSQQITHPLTSPSDLSKRRRRRGQKRMCRCCHCVRVEMREKLCIICTRAL